MPIRTHQLRLLFFFLILCIATAELVYASKEETDSDVLDLDNNEYGEEGRRRRRRRKAFRYLIPMVAAAVLIKAVLFPLAFKAMAVMSSISVIMSTFSLVLASIIGYTKLTKHQPTGNSIAAGVGSFDRREAHIPAYDGFPYPLQN